MNQNLYKHSVDPSRWAWSLAGAVAQAAPALTAPNFSGFSAPPDKPFLPQFGLDPRLSLAPSPPPPPPPPLPIAAGARKRRNDSLSGLDYESRQRKVFISEERMLDHLQRLNLEQGPDILQDLTSEAETHSLSGASEFSERAPAADAEVDGASSIASDEEEAESDDGTNDSKVVLSDALKKYIERKPEVLPDGLLQKITTKPMGNPSGALVLWRPPGEQIREVIRNSLAKAESAAGRSVLMEDASLTEPPPPANPSPPLPFRLAGKPTDEAQPSLRPRGCLPDLLIDQPACPRPVGIFSQMISTSSPPVSSNDGWSFEQMET